MNLEPLGIAIFCDDIRNEVGGGISIIGANPKEKITFKRVKEGSYMIPIIGFYMKILIPKDYKFNVLLVTAFLEESGDKKKLFDFSRTFEDMSKFLHKEQDGEPLYIKLTFAHRVPGVVCRPEGKIRVRMVFDDKKPMPLGTLDYSWDGV